jgi:hypothetical protein
MSCSQNAGLAARVKCGIQGAASRRGFYAGLTLGAAGLAGAGLVALARRRSRMPWPGNASPKAAVPAIPLATAADRPALPRLTPRPKAEPLTGPPVGERCAGCQTPGGSKPGGWYRLNGRLYCPDCAPEAARQAGVDLVKTAAAGSGQKGAAVITAADRRVAPLSPEKGVRTHLLNSRIGLRLGREGGLVPVEGYVVLRPDGSDTGLAVNPGLKVSQRNGVSAVVIEAGQWWLTHIPSGKGLAGPYPTPETAHHLAAILAQVDWTRNENELSPREIEQLRETVKAFGNDERGTRNDERGMMNDESKIHHSSFITHHSSFITHHSLEGKILADGRGGVARVLAERGDRLFMIDSLGERYEINRNETRPADESDFELCRVAMSFDPTSRAESRCARCGRSTRQTGAGEMWYRMSWQTFCESCARRYAVEEGYAFEEEIGDSLELESR